MATTSSSTRAPVWGTGAWPWLLVLLATAILGFWKPYFGRIGMAQAMTHLHAAAMLCWIGLLIAQPLLLRAGARDWHRAAGRASYVVVPLVAASALVLAQQRIATVPPQALALQRTILYLGISGTTMLLLVWGLGIRHRRDAVLHARYMAGTALVLVDPIVARLMVFWVPSVPPPMYVWISYALAYTILALLVWRDRNPRGRRALVLLAALFVALHASILVVPGTTAWQRFALWYASL